MIHRRNVSLYAGFAFVGFICDTNTDMQLSTRTLWNCDKCSWFTSMYASPFQEIWKSYRNLIDDGTTTGIVSVSIPTRTLYFATNMLTTFSTKVLWYAQMVLCFSIVFVLFNCTMRHGFEISCMILGMAMLQAKDLSSFHLPQHQLRFPTECTSI